MTGFYLTTPIYYANDAPHIGHAYTTIAADAIARNQRQRGSDVFLLTGTDEHGINIERLAAARGVAPETYVQTITAQFKALWRDLDIRYDRFIRTTDADHRLGVLAFWDRLQTSGDLYRATYRGAYCSRCEAYYQSDELEDGRCPVHGLPCDDVAEENWFFRLSRYQKPLERLVRETDYVQPETRRNEVLGQLAQGLSDFSVTRRQVRWGIPVPQHPDEVIYVWVDALVNYLTGIGYPDESFEHFWPAELHLIGKEIIRFHCLYWPALLLGAGLPLPKRVFAHGWLTNQGKKISKTTGNTIDPSALVSEFGSDAVRYYFLRAVPFGQDGDFSRTNFVARYTADLANDFGNLVQRVTSLGSRHSGLPIQERGSGDDDDAVDRALRGRVDELKRRLEVAFAELALHEAAAAVGDFVRSTNRYLDATAPWSLAKTGDTDRLATVLGHALEAAKVAARAYAPIIPRASAEALRRLNATPPEVGAPLFPRLADAVD